MSIEIEKRFLVKGDNWKKHIAYCEEIRQGYLSTNFEEWITRVRIIENKDAFITLKNSISGLINHEFEYIIPIEDAEFIWNKSKKKLRKKRYHLTLSNGYWIVDCFSEANSPLVIAEVELATTETVVIKPSWCDVEITGRKELTNAALASFPISHWSSKNKKILNIH